MPAKLVRLIRMIMEQSKGRIILENILSIKILSLQRSKGG
jgi:hypothetical protein